MVIFVLKDAATVKISEVIFTPFGFRKIEIKDKLIYIVS